MGRTLIEIPPPVYRALSEHLLPEGAEVERAAFVFARYDNAGAEAVFRFVDWLPVESEGVDRESSQYLELTDETRSAVIKRAHDLGASLIEFHCHLGPWPAAFSLSDKLGFEEFLPHVWWRLKGRPYAAVVVAPTGIDALCWVTGPKNPELLRGLLVGERLVEATGLTLGYWKEVERGGPV